MLKKILLAAAIFTSFNTVYAEEACYIKDENNVCYEDMQTAINTTTTSKLTLQNDINLNLTANQTYVTINKDMTIDLNGHNIVSDVNTSFKVTKGNVKFTGTGTITSTLKTHSAIAIAGSNDKTAKDYTVVTVDENVTLNAGYGAFVTLYSNAEPYAYGVTVNFKGKTETNYSGLYMNGSIQHTENYPVFNIKDNAVVDGLYIAGYAEVNIGKATITTTTNGSVAMKSGKLFIDGATITNHSNVEDDTQPDTNGIDSSKAVIQVASNSAYAGNIEITIKDGNFTSKNGFVFSEYIEKGTESKVTKLEILGGTFTSPEGHNIFSYSENFGTNMKKFISGGTYSNAIAKDHIKDGYIANKKETTYVIEPVKQETEVPEIDTTKPVEETTMGIVTTEEIKQILTSAIKENFENETKDINATIDVQITNNKTVTETEKTAIEAILKEIAEEAVVETYFDITLVVKNTDNDTEIGTIEELSKEITLTVVLPENIQKVKDGYTREFYIVRIHDGKAEKINATLSEDGTYVTFKTNKFSTYALGYNDVVKATNNEKVPSTYDGIIFYVGLATISVLGFAGVVLYINKKKLS